MLQAATLFILVLYLTIPWGDLSLVRVPFGLFILALWMAPFFPLYRLTKRQGKFASYWILPLCLSTLVFAFDFWALYAGMCLFQDLATCPGADAQMGLIMIFGPFWSGLFSIPFIILCYALGTTAKAEKGAEEGAFLGD